LAARVAVNHLWLRHFGKALVASTFDFGTNGPTADAPGAGRLAAVELMEPAFLPAGCAVFLPAARRTALGR